MRLSEKQQEFSRCLGLLLCYATKQGYGIITGDCFRDPRLHGKTGIKKGYGHKNSTHKLCLAFDANLMIESEHIKSSQHAAWGDLHEYWESLSSMAAPMIISDAGHFSFEHNGVW